MRITSLSLLISTLFLGAMGSPLVDYRFSCNSGGQPQVYSDSIMADLFDFDLSLAKCDFDHQGVSSTNMIESKLPIVGLRGEFLETNATGFALELWITPIADNDFGVSKPIFSIGGHHFRDDDDDYNFCRNMELYLGLRGNLLEIKYVDNDVRNSCRTLLVRQQAVENEKLVQVVLALNQGDTSLYINGQPIVKGAPNEIKTNLTMWNPESTLQLFSNQFVTSAFTGSLHQVAIYDQALHAEEIALSYQNRSDIVQNNQEPLNLIAFTQAVTALQGNSSVVAIGGFNKSTDDYSVQVEITSLPRFGNFMTGRGTVKSTGQRFHLDNESSNLAFIYYKPWSKDVFTSPRFSFSGQDLQLPIETFKYRLVAVDKNGLLVGWSDIVRQEIIIRHVNQPPTLFLPETATPLSVQGSGLGDRPVANIENVILQDPDSNIDRVRVDIWAMNGTLEIQNNFELADFESCADRSYPYSWWCHGSFKGSRNMTFLAEPDDVSVILSSIRYKGFHWDQEDSITIRIFDGSGGPCLEDEEHKYNSIHLACYEIETTISVPSMARGSKKFDIRKMSLGQICFYIVVIVCLLACSRVWLFCRSLWKCLRVRGSRIEVDGDQSDDDTEVIDWDSNV